MTAKAMEEQIKKHIQKWAVLFGISDYTFVIELHSDKELNGNYAEVDTDDETREATISFNQARLTREPDEIERTVIHELLHTRFNEYAELSVSILNEYAPNLKTKRLIAKQLEKTEHKIVVALTDTLAKRGK